ncbi:NAD(P)/FAD-dependent oxidoreductase [Kitasatospora sp. NPDC001547]|uniref:NAD(P)/FAD-dependent oxidoreductase n=1 Tax=Kitasatospora sp. NPDC001547 TaxID=3364015 RepID=UPI0036A319A0
MRTEDIDYTAFTGWIDPPSDVLPALKAEITCDVAVVGGGLGGMSTALRLAERGIDVVLLEAEFCGHGSSSRNAGQLAGGPGGDIQMLDILYPKRLPSIVRFAENAAHFVESLMKRLDIECDYEPTGNVGVAVSKGQMGRVRRVAEILARCGATVEVGTSAELGIPRSFVGGFLEPVGGMMNPGKFTLGVRRALLASSARVFEQTRVEDVEPSGDGVLVSVPGGRVRANRVVLSTNAFGGELRITPKRLASPIWVTEVETEPIDPARLAALGWTSRSGVVTQHAIMQNYRLTPRNTIITGVRRLQRGRYPLPPGRTADESVVAGLVDGFRTHFPSLAGVEFERAWGGWVAVTPSWLPVAGQVGDTVYYSIGCNGHGLGQAPYLGQLIADRIAGDAPHEDLLALWRTKPRFLPSPPMTRVGLRAVWLVDRIADRFNGSRRHAKGN